jgi:FixJ family two-component response regulator
MNSLNRSHADSASLSPGEGAGENRATVYVVDDEPMVLQSLVQLLESVGLRVVGCAHAAEFLGRFHPQERCCIVLDDRMPEMSGVTLAGMLLKVGSTVPIILLSASDDPRIVAAAKDAGVMDCLIKPFEPSLLVQRVRQALKLA